MSSIGFGLERAGLLTLRFPRLVALFVLLVTVACAAQLPRMSVDGDLMRIFTGSGEYYDRYARLTETFGTFEQDAYLLVTSDRLTDPSVIEDLRFFGLELELNDFAVGTMSPFSLRTPGPNDQTVPAVPENMADADEVAAALTELRRTDPIMNNLIAEDLSGLVFIMFPDADRLEDAGGIQAMIASLRELIADYSGSGFEVELTGPPIWTAEMLDASLNDQARFTLFGFIIGAIISFVALRSFWGAVIASLIPVVAVVWVVGAVLMVFGSFTFLTNIVVTLTLVIAFAESMYFCFTWLRLWNRGLEPREAIVEAIRRVLPAAALTTITTAVSFGTLAVIQGQGIREFGLSGVLAIFMAYLTFATFMPLVMMLAVRLGYRPPRKMSIAVTAPIPPSRYITSRFFRPIALLSLLGMGLMMIPVALLEPRFSFDDFLPRDSEALQTAQNIDAGTGGVAPLYVRVPLRDADPNFSDADFELVREAHRVLESQVGEGKVISGASLFAYAEAGFSREQVFQAVGPFLRQRFVTDDGTQALITGFMPTIVETEALRDVVETTDALLAEAGIAGAEVAGFGLMTMFASTDIIYSIRNSLMAAIVINIFLIGLAFRSWQLGLVSLVPNLLPILGTQAYLFFSGDGLQLTTVIALTIAFGIAVDDTIHYLANYARLRKEGVEHSEATDLALQRIGPAIVATTLIICAGVSVVAFSALPPVALFGTLTVVTLLLALLGALIVFPSLLYAGGRFFHRIGVQTT